MDALIDAVIAITMTLLVLELRLPEEIGGDLFAAVLDLSPKIISWVVSFLILALLWRGQMRAAQGLEHVDGRLFQILIVWLMLTSVVPFTCSLIGEHNELPQSHVLYGANLIAIEAVAILRNAYFRRHPELFAGQDVGHLATGMSQAATVTICALGSMAFAYFYQTDYASAVYALIVPVQATLTRLGVR
jgi:uncharacterized membrane protein